MTRVRNGGARVKGEGGKVDKRGGSKGKEKKRSVKCIP